MDMLTERQKYILTLIIHEYTRTASPVGSVNLVGRYSLDMSSATVRNEMAVLEDMGFLRHPHTSSGRVPTEEGYRFFVTRLLHDTDLPDNTRHLISHQFYQSRHDVDEWLHLAAAILAKQSRAASIVTSPRAEMPRFKHLELVSTRGRQILMIVVMIGGDIRQRILMTDELIPQDQLSQSAARISMLIEGKPIDAIQAVRSQFQGLDADVIDWVVGEMSQNDPVIAGEIYLDGLSNVLAEPEFSGPDDARKALRLLEERPLLQDLINRTVMTSSVGIVQVLIGGEGTWEDLRQTSVILARYGIPGLATGTLGVLGPMRMPYGRTISTVRFVANLLSDMVTETMAD